MSVLFNRWETFVDRCRRDWPEYSHLPAKELVTRMLELAYEDNDERRIAQWSQSNNMEMIKKETAWSRFGSPYYKVWPGIADSLSKTKLNFDTSHLHWPYYAFEVCLGGRECGEDWFDTKGSVLVSFHSADWSTALTDDEIDQAYSMEETKLKMKSRRDRSLVEITKMEKERGKSMRGTIGFHYGKFGDPDEVVVETRFVLFKDTTIEEDLMFSYQGLFKDDGKETAGTYLDSDNLHKLATVVIGVMMFGIHNHEMVLPDIKTPVIVGRGKMKKALERQAIRKEVKKCKGWLVGSEIDLPQPEVIGSTNERPGCGTPLKFGHVRSGHMRLQPCGPQRKDRKLIFVEPTVVRSDLPVRQSHGYRIKDTLLTGGA